MPAMRPSRRGSDGESIDGVVSELRCVRALVLGVLLQRLSSEGDQCKSVAARDVVADVEMSDTLFVV